MISEEKKIAEIKKTFAAIPSLYIADGHHRCASAVRVGQMRRQAHPDFTGAGGV